MRQSYHKNGRTVGGVDMYLVTSRFKLLRDSPSKFTGRIQPIKDDLARHRQQNQSKSITGTSR
jgi:hypothetical protein